MSINSKPKSYELIILDRDGVINHESPHSIRAPSEWRALPRSLEAIAVLTQRGYRLAVATNQSGVARGYYTEETLGQIHDKMCRAVEISGGVLDWVHYCPHGPHAGCVCRKPAPGLLLDIIKRFAVLPERTLMIGDSLRDLEAAEQAGCDSVLVKTGHGAETLQSPAWAQWDQKNTLVFESLWDVVDRHPVLKGV